VRILIADDDSFSRRFLAKTVEPWGYAPVLAANGEEAWNILNEDDAPRLVLLDWMMPDTDGLELCRRIRELGQSGGTYVIMLTANNSTADLVSSINAGADDFVTKSFDVRELEVRLRAGKRIVELQEALWTLATRDPLTSLWNHGAILDILKRELNRAQRCDEKLSVMMMDIDHFKSVNDTYGHKGGDAALVEVSKRLGAELRDYDTVGRYGGEEFVVILPEAAGVDAETVAERLRQSIARESFAIEGHMVPITISIGVASTVDGDFDAESLLRSADASLYEAKHNGRNRIEFANSEGMRVSK
jgi:two-component system cell cycle response regulator